MPSFRGLHASVGFRVFGVRITQIAYLDEFGHVGPYVVRRDPRPNDSPVFGLAGFVAGDRFPREAIHDRGLLR